MSERISDVRTVHEGWLSLRMVRIRMDTGDVVEREVVDHPNGAAVLLYNPDKRTALLVSELRPPVDYAGEPPMLEVVAGKIDEGDGADCARREALEEAGVRIGQLEHVGRFWATPASSTERVDYFLAAFTDAERIAKGGGLEEEAEHVRVHEIPLARLWKMTTTGELRDAKTMLLLQALKFRTPELFT
jgi:nudix-type nucleoside diphosphatase (YffH/AdpP family)